MFYNYIIFNYYFINEVILLSETNVLCLSSFSFNLVWVAYLFSSTNYLGVPNSAPEPTSENLFSFTTSRFYILKH